MMQAYGYGTDGMFYHASQVKVDATGRWVPLPGAHAGQIDKLNEFGEAPVIPDDAAALLKAWRAGLPAAATAEDAQADDTATYATKVVTPAAPATDVLAKDDEAGRAKALRGEK